MHEQNGTINKEIEIIEKQPNGYSGAEEYND